jgi:hypothetical protein
LDLYGDIQHLFLAGTQGIALPSLITTTATDNNNAPGNSIRRLFMGVLTKIQKTWGRFLFP